MINYQLFRPLSLVLILLLCNALNAQIVDIPDSKFKSYLLRTSEINTNGDDEIQESEAAAVTSLNVHQVGIESLEGLEAFTSLTSLYCMRNNLTSLNLSKNPTLVLVQCSENEITNINVSNNTALTSLLCSDNKLENIDLSNNPNLEDFFCSNNKGITLDLKNNTKLKTLMCLYCNLQTLDLQANTALENLNCQGNNLVSLDLSKCSALNRVVCSYNDNLAYLNVANGNNNLIPQDRFEAEYNYALECITVSDVAYATQTWTTVDKDIVFSSNCSLGVTYNLELTITDGTNALTGAIITIGYDEYKTDANGKVTLNDLIPGGYKYTVSKEGYDEDTGFIIIEDADISKEVILSESIVNIPDANFKAYLIGNSTINTNGDDEIQESEAKVATEINVWNKNIASLEGIRAFTALKVLDCSFNKLVNLDVSKNTLLEKLICYENDLSDVDVSVNTALIELSCYENNITSLDVSQNSALEILTCSSNKLTDLDISQNLALKELSCHSNNLTVLDVNNNTVLEKLYCYSNSLKTLDLSQNIALKDLWCYDNELNLLNVSNSTALTRLMCYENNLTELDVSNNTALNRLICYSNSLSSLDVSKNTELVYFSCHSNNLTALDVSQNLNLAEFVCNANKLTTLDVSNNTALRYLYCHENNLTALDVRNGNNSLINENYFKAQNNPNLYCINVSDVEYATKTWTYFDNKVIFSTDCPIGPIFNAEFTITDGTNPIAGATVTFGSDVYQTDVDGKVILTELGPSDYTYAVTFAGYQESTGTLSIVDSDVSLEIIISEAIVYIPDVNFKANLVANAEINTNGDDEIQINEAKTVTSLDVSSQGIASLEGIEAFINLQSLLCSDNSITNLDLSKNLTLIELDCFNNQLTDLDLSKNTKLNKLHCGSNKLTVLDLTQNPVLSRMYCNDNNLISLDIRNGNNQAINSRNTFGAERNPNLHCINVDDVAYSTNTWTYIDAGVIFSTDCPPIPTFNLELTVSNGMSTIEGVTVIIRGISYTTNSDGIITIADLYAGDYEYRITAKNHQKATGTITIVDADISETITLVEDVVYIPDANFKAYLVGNTTINKNNDDEIQISEAEAVTRLNVYNYDIVDLTGVEAFISLTDLNCQRNQLLSLDVSALTGLTELLCGSNLLEKLDLSNNILLDKLDCSSNNLPQLDVSANTDLAFIHCGRNKIISLDLSQNTKLEYVYCRSNELTHLDLRNGNNQLIGNTHNVSYLYADDNPFLSCINVSDVDYANATWEGIDEGVVFSTDCSSLVKVTLTPTNRIDVFPGAEVIINGVTYITDDNGQVSIYLLEAGDIEYETEIQGYKKASGTITVKDTDINTRILLIPVYTLELTITDGSALLEGASVTINSVEYTSDADGKITITGLEAGDYEYTAALKGYDNTKGTINIPYSDISETITLSLSTYSLEVTITNGTDVLENASVIINSIEYTTDANGKVTLENLLAGTYNYAVSFVDYQDANGTISIADADKSEEIILLESVVYIPDANFKSFLLKDTEINTNGDDEIQLSEARAATIVEVQNQSINSLEGIEEFTALERLNCAQNNLTSLDISKISGLKQLFCFNNDLTSLDVSLNTSLTVINCAYNTIDAIDVKIHTDLENLLCNHNKLSSLDVSQNPKLKQLYCHSNNLNELDVRNGNNSIMEESTLGIPRFRAEDNPQLSCINVSDVDFAKKTWTSIDEGVIFSTDCSQPNLFTLEFIISDGTNIIVDAELEINGTIYKTDADGKVTLSNISPDTYTYTVYVAGYVKTGGSVIITDSDISEVITLEKETLVQEIQLKEGWNFVCLYVQPNQTEIKTLFPAASFVKNTSGFYDASKPAFTNSIQTIEAGIAYLIKTESDYTVEVTGTEIQAFQPQTLTKGWNLIGNPYTEPITLTALLESVKGSVTSATNSSGTTLDIGTETIHPGEVIYIQVSDDCEFLHSGK